MLCLQIVAVAMALTADTVRFTTADRVPITATYRRVSATRSPAVLLIHSLTGQRSDWNSFAGKLQQAGLASLALDLRGHGDSKHKRTLDQFSSQDFADMLLDVNAAVDWLENRPEIDPSRLAVVGSSVGANLAIRYAQFNPDLAGLLLLSPGLNYRGIRTDDAIPKLGPVALRLIVAQGDGFAYESCKRLVELRAQAGIRDAARELTVSSGGLHGLQLLDKVAGLADFAIHWLQQSLRVATNDPAPRR